MHAHAMPLDVLYIYTHAYAMCRGFELGLNNLALTYTAITTAPKRAGAVARRHSPLVLFEGHQTRRCKSLKVSNLEYQVHR